MPKYQILARQLRQQIVDGTYPPGSRIPSESSLQEQFQVSRQTVRNALELLERQNFVRSRQGSGTYVIDQEAEELTKSKRIAVVTTYVDNYIFPRIIQGIEQVLSAEGFQMQIAFTGNRIWKEEAILRDLLEQDLRGILIETTKSALPNPNLPLYRELQKKGLPILFLNSRYPELDCPMISLEDEAAGRMGAEYLMDHGHSRIGGFFKLDDGQGIRRYQGFINALRDRGITPAEDGILWFDTEDAVDFGQMEERILKRFSSCTGILCYNDSAASRLMEIWKRHGISVPEDISLVSIDNTDLAELGDVGLTSIHHPKEKLGEKAAKQLISMIRSHLPGTSYEFAPYLVERTSVRNLTENKIQS